MPRAIAILGVTLAAVLLQPAAVHAEPSRPQTIALISTLGDQLDIVRKRGPRSSKVNELSRHKQPVDGQMLNYSVLRGLDAALAAEEPDSRRVMLRWQANEALAEQLRDASFEKRDELTLAALIERLSQMPQRAEWDRIEAILPHYAWDEHEGMPRRLGGMGIYVQPTGNQWELMDDDGVDRSKEYAAEQRQTVNPKTGARQKDNAFVAPFMSFDRVTLDARTLAVLSRKPAFVHTKYSDPDSKSIDVIEQVPPEVIVSQLAALAERAAYQSVRGKASSVEVGPIKQVPTTP